MRLLILLLLAISPFVHAADNAARYTFRAEHDPDGSGKFFMGREIAQVMGHQGAEWLERPERETEEAPAKAIAAMGLKVGDAVADIGAGTGYFSWRLAQVVGPKGMVYAEEIQPEMLEILRTNLTSRGVQNFKEVLGTITDTKLPTNSIDLAIMVDVYHEFSHPYEMIASITRSLKPEGRIAFVEYRLEDPTVPIKRVHKMSIEQVKTEMSLQSLDYVTTVTNLPRQHVIIFKHRTTAGAK